MQASFILIFITTLSASPIPVVPSGSLGEAVTNAFAHLPEIPINVVPHDGFVLPDLPKDFHSADTTHSILVKGDPHYSSDDRLWDLESFTRLAESEFPVDHAMNPNHFNVLKPMVHQESSSGSLSSQTQGHFSIFDDAPAANSLPKKAALAVEDPLGYPDLPLLNPDHDLEGLKLGPLDDYMLTDVSPAVIPKQEAPRSSLRKQREEYNRRYRERIKNQKLIKKQKDKERRDRERALRREARQG